MLCFRRIRFLTVPLLTLTFLLALAPTLAYAQEGGADEEHATTVPTESESTSGQTGESGQVVAADEAVATGVAMGLLTLVLVVVMGVVVLGAVGLGVIGLGAWISQGDGG